MESVREIDEEKKANSSRQMTMAFEDLEFHG